MIRVLTRTGIVCLALGCLSLGACAPGAKSTRIAQAPTGMHEISALYEKATKQHRRAVRKPVREEQARAMRLLAVKSDQLLTETEAWDSEARLTSVDAAERDQVRATVVGFRDSLRSLSAAAERSSISDLRKHHAAAMAAYRRLTTITDTVD